MGGKISTPEKTEGVSPSDMPGRKVSARIKRGESQTYGKKREKKKPLLRPREKEPASVTSVGKKKILPRDAPGEGEETILKWEKSPSLGGGGNHVRPKVSEKKRGKVSVSGDTAAISN